MNDRMLSLFVWQQVLRREAAARLRADDWGEGVVSLAVGVLITSLLGVALWVALRVTLGHATQTVDNQVAKIGG